MEINYQKPLIIAGLGLIVLTAFLGNVWLAVVGFSCLAVESVSALVEYKINSRKLDQVTILQEKIAALEAKVEHLNNSISLISRRV